MTGPRRIVCLTEETTETLYLLGEQKRIVGISAYTVRPPQAKKRHPVVSAFIGGCISKIKTLKPDLVVGFSDVQAEFARGLVAEGLNVLITNQRSLKEILETIRLIGNIVGAGGKAKRLAASFERRLVRAETEAKRLARHPRVYFEEWNEPRITAIRWVSELIALAGGRPLFAKKSKSPSSKGRVVSDAEILKADPEVAIASWCGKPFDRRAFESRPGYAEMSAVRFGRVHELESSLILQPGPACLTDGLDALRRAISRRA
ncbi:MAG: cobalamin-binding protein [Elusimicrobia bacterium CG1_02_63_36]|nr:MAG: cobalamin-binding protein [Elusimicrobia bacterium CG1_02_63_36]PIP84537.1 MAG: cobalamin-binding protein [Elusimicrobia bacterium CG22_combo_CG10-13_8_21_14_all_63_91]PJA14572.1 MAG: cobalamin-binding protein [Elusimicrobia bacterium CG_4_10_14_0_2_um_filter_63_34]PJB26846.1 MAG: cobalamin-binding protein [Elusimicrobia bacterium CG_4_9_14_3_um_filter_62_55]